MYESYENTLVMQYSKISDYGEIKKCHINEQE